MNFHFMSSNEKLNTEAFFHVKGCFYNGKVCIKSFSGKEIVDKYGCFFTKEDLNSFFKKRVLPKSHLSISRVGKMLFICNICNNNFSSYGNLRDHDCFRRKCEHCDQIFTELSKLKKHLRSHLSEKPFVCKECGKNYKFNYQLNRHLLTHSVYKCEVCRKKFPSLIAFKEHFNYNDHTLEPPHKCPICGKGFKQRNLLKKHSVIHSFEKPYTCAVCDKGFNSRSGLFSHTSYIHTHDKLYTCELCNKTFHQISRLKVHYRTHTHEKPFQCEVCHKCFSIKHKLSVHYRVHTDEKPYHCDKCNKSYRQKCSLKIHERTHNF